MSEGHVTLPRQNSTRWPPLAHRMVGLGQPLSPCHSSLGSQQKQLSTQMPAASVYWCCWASQSRKCHASATATTQATFAVHLFNTCTAQSAPSNLSQLCKGASTHALNPEEQPLTHHFQLAWHASEGPGPSTFVHMCPAATQLNPHHHTCQSVELLAHSVP